MTGQNDQERWKDTQNDDEVRGTKSKRSRYVRKAWCVLRDLSPSPIWLIFSSSNDH